MTDAVASWLPIDWHLFIIVLIFILLDIASGVIAAIKNGELQSNAMRVGLLHKLGYILAIILGIACDFGSAYLDLNIPFDLTVIIISAICLTEIVSIIENIGLIIPEFGVVLQGIFEKKPQPDVKREDVELEELETKDA